MSKITETVERLARPVVEQEGCSLWDVEYVREAGSYYLRVFIDHEGGVSIDDCEKISRLLDPMLDEADPIPDSYTFEVGSAGLSRELKRPEHFAQYLGSEVEVRTYRAVDGQKMLVGALRSYDNGDVTICAGEREQKIAAADVAQVRLHVSI